MHLRLTILLLSVIAHQAIFVRSQVTKDIVDTAIAAGNFGILVQLLTAADLVTPLKAPGPFTVFAPNDAAFNKLPAGTVDDLLKPENKEKLTNILQYHVLSGNITAAAVLEMALPASSPETLLKKLFILDKDASNRVKANDATVTTADTFATNGVIHTIDTVLIPPTDIVDTAVANPNFKTLVAALTAADLVTALKGSGPFTVFAPTDAAFGKLPAGVVDELVKPENKATLTKILSYHVTQQIATSSSINRMTLPATITMLAGGTARVSKDGNTVKINDASVTTADIFNLNGMIHVIDTVILPPLDTVETALTNGNFKTLLTALKAAELTDTLKGAGPFTVFAPNDAAFAKLPNGTIDDLLKPENKNQLVTLLKYHVISGKKITSDELTPSQQLDMLDGGSVSITKDGDDIKINGNKIIVKNVETSNGIIHIIDGVLTPTERSAMSRQSSQTMLIIFLSMFLSIYRFIF